MKISCQATCQKCYHELGRRQDLDVNDLVWHCTSCNRIYLCDIGLGRLGTSFSCPFDNTVVIKEEVDKSMIKKEGIPGANDQRTEDVYYKLRKKDKKSKKKAIKHSKGSSKILSTFLRSKISELNDIEQLSILLLIEITKLQKFNIKNTEKLKKCKSKKEFLELLGSENGEIIDFLYSTLFKLENFPYAIEIRFAVYILHALANIEKIKIEESSSSKLNLTLINFKGEETLVYCANEDMDLKDLEKLASNVFSIDFKSHPKVKRIMLVANSFSYMAKGMIRKYESALTAIDGRPDKKTTELFKSLPISLWQPIPGKFQFQNVTLK